MPARSASMWPRPRPTSDKPQARHASSRTCASRTARSISSMTSKGTERRIEHIAAQFQPADARRAVHRHRQVRLEGADRRFQLRADHARRPPRETPGEARARPRYAGDRRALRRQRPDPAGLLRARASCPPRSHSIPSLLAWMREKPPAATAIGDGELASHARLEEGRDHLQRCALRARACERAGPGGRHLADPAAACQGGARARSSRPQPVSRGQRLGGPATRPSRKQPSRARHATPRRAVPRQAQLGRSLAASDARKRQEQFTKPDGSGRSAERDRDRRRHRKLALTPAVRATDDASPPTPPVAPAAAPVASPASFDADVNLNVRKTRVAHLELGPSSLGLAFRDGVLNATLGGMELYDGHATGKLVLDAAKPVPAFTGDFRLDGVAGQDAAVATPRSSACSKAAPSSRFRSAAPARNRTRSSPRCRARAASP